MCSIITHADFILRSIENGFPYDESIKNILKKALSESSSEIRVDCEVTLFGLKDAKELLTAYLENPKYSFSLSINAEFILMDNPKYYDLYVIYINARELDEETQIYACSYGADYTKTLMQMYHEKHGLCSTAFHAAKARQWI
jgi:hypothetical protein